VATSYSEEKKTKSYGELKYCTITDLILAAITVATAVGGFENVRMYKRDVVGAFGQ
jgi:hypothetical protein